MKHFLRLLALCACIAPLCQAEKIFFDLGYVLFSTSKLAAVRSVGITTYLRYYWQRSTAESPKEAYFKYLDLLKPRVEGVPESQSGSVVLPQYILDWLAGSYSSNQALLDELVAKIEANPDCFYSDVERRMVTKTAQFMFDPAQLAAAQRIIPAGLTLVEDCYAQLDEDGERAHQLYVISNWDPESFKILYQDPELQDLWAMFDGLVISGQEQCIKPGKQIFDRAKEVAKVQEGDTLIFIDDQPENITAATKYGFDAILCDSHESVRTELEERGIIPTDPDLRS